MTQTCKCLTSVAHSNQQSSCTQERATCRSFRDRRPVVHAIDMPRWHQAKDNIGLRITATLQAFKPWQDFHMKLLPHSMGILFIHEWVVARHQRVNCTLTSSTNLGSISKKIKIENFEYGFGWWSVLRSLEIPLEPWQIVLPHSVPSLADFCWDCLKSKTTPFWSKERNKNSSSIRKSVEISIVTKDLAVKIDLTVTLPFSAWRGHDVGFLLAPST